MQHSYGCQSSWRSAAADTGAGRLPSQRSTATGSRVVYRQTALRGPLKETWRWTCSSPNGVHWQAVQQIGSVLRKDLQATKHTQQELCSPQHPQTQTCACRLLQLHHPRTENSALQFRDAAGPDTQALLTNMQGELSWVLDLQAIGLCPSCNTTWVKALTKGPVLLEDKGSLPSQSMQMLHVAILCSCT